MIGSALATYLYTSKTEKFDQPQQGNGDFVDTRGGIQHNGSNGSNGSNGNGTSTYNYRTNNNVNPNGNNHRNGGRSSGTSGTSGVVIFFIVLMYLIEIALGIWAAMLSWKSNSLIEWGTGFKVLFSIFAFFGGWHYLLIHLINKQDLILAIRKSKAGVAPAFAPGRVSQVRA